jgi:cobalt-zinc-cadmium efflux system protein
LSDSHNHSHSHTGDQKNIKVLIFAFVLTACFMVIEFIGGFISNSLALISDAGHMLSDVASLGIAVWAINWGTKKADLSKTFGYKRIETIAAFVNGLTLVLVAGMILIEGVKRLLNPVEIQQEQLIIIASIGLFINLVIAFILFKNSKESVNVRGAFLHVLSDLLGSVGAILAGLIIQFTGWLYADPLISIIIAILIIISSVKLLKDTFHTLMEGTPKDMDLKVVIDEIMKVPDITGVHDLHIWSLNESKIFLTAHIMVNDNIDSRNKISEVKKVLHDNFHIEHSTLELETVRCDTGCD